MKQLWGKMTKLNKKELINDYNTSARLYDLRYNEEQTLKIEFLLMRVKMKSHNIVLDVGCGTGLLMQHLSRINRELFLIGIDSSIAMLREAKKKSADFELVLADCDHMPFKDKCCDIAFSISVFQLLDEPRRSLAETVRLLKKDGDFAITILRKSKDAFCLNNIRDANIEVYDSETMKDVFLIGRRTVINDGEDVTAI